jgi:DNA-binding LacI/PurR family transcriptional regulator
MRVSTHDLAREAGVHQTTVSRALRNDRGVSEELRKRIQELAVKRGYSPDPMLSALVYHRTRKSVPKYQATFGWITNYPTRDGWCTHERMGQFNGVTRRAIELGYQVEHFWLHEPGIDPERLTRMLLARNIQGLFFMPQFRPRARVRLDWRHFTAITFNHTLARPILHTVTNHHFRSMRLIMRTLKKRGYRRIGLACWPSIQEAVDRNWTAAYWAYQPKPYLLSIPPFVERDWKREKFYHWYDAYRPDVVIAQDVTLLTWLKEHNLRVPQDVAFVLAARHEFEDIAGIDENTEKIGATAVNVMVDMLHRGEKGIPKIPLCSLVEGTWVEGPTIRPPHQRSTADTEEERAKEVS